VKQPRLPLLAVAAECWINQYDRERVHALADLKSALEQEPMGNHAGVRRGRRVE
jgi:hypothetical protein